MGRINVNFIWQCDVCVCVLSFVLLPAIPTPELIQCYHLTTFSGLRTGPPITFHFCLFVLSGWVVWFVLVLYPFPTNAGFADGLFVMTTATDHKNNLNRSVLKTDYARTLRVETIANSAGGTAQVSIVAQAKYRIPEHQILLQWFPYGGYGRLPWPNHRRTHPVQILDPFGIPLGYDGAHGHGPGGCDHSIWHPGPSKRRNDMGLARL